MSVLVLDKPVGPTSFDVVRAVGRLVGRRRGPQGRRLRVGHGGTLDPLASGVLPVCVGEATKLAPFLLEADKTYEAALRLGEETDTLDAAGRVLARAPVPALTEEAVRAALARFRGEVTQVPPMYSAIKRAGRPLYEYARRGEEVAREPRRVRIHEIELVAWRPPAELVFRVRCSKGTYVRTLGADVARALGTAGHLTGLRRTASGPFSIEQAVTLAEAERRLEAGEALPWLSLPQALAHLPAVSVTGAIAEALARGQPVSCEAAGVGPEALAAGRVRVLRPDGCLVAVAEGGPQGRLRTLRIFGADDA